MDTYIIPVRFVTLCKIIVVADSLEEAITRAPLCTPSERRCVLHWEVVEKKDIKVYSLKDRKGIVVLPNMVVAVPEPQEGDEHTAPFHGEVMESHTNPILVIDDHRRPFCIDAERVEIIGW